MSAICISIPKSSEGRYLSMFSGSDGVSGLNRGRKDEGRGVEIGEGRKYVMKVMI